MVEASVTAAAGSEQSDIALILGPVVSEISLRPARTLRQNVPVEPTEIVRDGIRLRLFAEPDADDVTSACDDPLTRRFVPDMPSPYTRADALRWITEQSVAAWRGHGYAGRAARLLAGWAFDTAGISRGGTAEVPARPAMVIGLRWPAR